MGARLDTRHGLHSRFFFVTTNLRKGLRPIEDVRLSMNPSDWI